MVETVLRRSICYLCQMTMACDIHGANQRAPTKSMCHPAEKVEEPLMQQRLCLSGLRGAGSNPS